MMTKLIAKRHQLVEITATLKHKHCKKYGRRGDRINV
jgi:hypothetical protein